ncbi:Mn2+/Fe2+ NRAMP family transporter [Haloferula luteola]|uniref:Mn2+/Fe2+ NRAMP family transporter n=1 Tax=Haloferula luteola TaxID=595692 RepID=A0A840VEA7_9BACT|nr:divalent metal cation transporter [Haloferula luteola]MBB5352200.1 Mn2+/Fe2+ NRAMP family transporter [Haloferula luteola]
MSDRETQLLDEAAQKGPLGRFFIYARLSGPGWLQGAITLGGGSLTGALYLGVIAGFGLMWLQPLAMVCGIIMLSAIAYVTLTTGQRPFHAIQRHLHPLLGWSWLGATVLANMVWIMPQFSLATAAIQQNLLSEKIPQTAIIVVLFLIGMGVNALYQAGGGAAKAFDLIIKIMVGTIVVSFFAVVVALTRSGQLEWSSVFRGFVPDFSLLFKPASGFSDLIERSSSPSWWGKRISSDQRDIIITAFGTAVGINMTFLLPYTLLKKKWGKRHRGLSITDLSVGLFIPFFLATSCVVIASASSFHTRTHDVAPGAGAPLIESLSAAHPTITPNEADRELADMLVKRDANALAITLEPFAGPVISQKIFGIGVLGMALSTIVILMLMNGTAFMEAFSSPHDAPSLETEPARERAIFFLGCALSGISGCLFPLFWNGASKAALAVPTSVIGGSLIPIAYFTFLLMMNSRQILGHERPTGRRRWVWNALMIPATAIATGGSVWVLWGKTQATNWERYFGWGGLLFLGLLFLIGTLGFLRNERRTLP